jgi:hypothetical protein
MQVEIYAYVQDAQDPCSSRCCWPGRVRVRAACNLDIRLLGTQFGSSHLVKKMRMTGQNDDYLQFSCSVCHLRPPRSR